MFTPQQIEEISFSRATFGGYDMQSVDEFLEPLTEDYITLYKENALLKSKMRVLVAKLEEYRQNEASMKEALADAQKTCDQMVKDAEVKCTQMLESANQTAADSVKSANVQIEEENARVEDARVFAAQQIEALQEQLRGCLEALEQIKQDNRPAHPVVKEKPVLFDMVAEEEKTHAVANEISQSLESLVGAPVEEAPKPEPKHPVMDATTSKFANLQFGRNYEVDNK